MAVPSTLSLAGSKRGDAGRLATASGKPVLFVARPELAPPSDELLYARPDDYSDHGKTWRQVLVEYNRLDANPRSLLPAHQLYCDAVYARLARHVGLQNLYILSAGWGLIHVVGVRVGHPWRDVEQHVVGISPWTAFGLLAGAGIAAWLMPPS